MTVKQWRYGKDGLELKLTVPFGSEALARLPDGRQALLGPGEHRYLI